MSKGINVLSLFDGMSCGQIALERAGIKVANYFASEIDKSAIEVTMHNYPNTIQIGDVTKVKSEDLPKIDLLIGGSPCQSISFAGKGEGFNGKSVLFFEYFRLLNETNPKYFLLENVVGNKKSIDEISKLLCVQPALINSRLFSAQNRPRYYWTNINFNKEIADRNILLEDIIDVEYSDDLILSGNGLNKIKRKRSRVVNMSSEKFPCLMASQSVKPTDAIVYFNGVNYRYPTTREMERMQTVPEGYTSKVSYNKAAKMLGNGWTVDVIAHILKHMEII